MQLKKFLVILAMVATVAMVGCRTVSSEPPSSTTIPKETQEEMSTAVTETEVATEAEDIIEATEPTDAPPEEPYDGFTLVNSPDFEPFEFFGERHLQTILEREGIEDINFFKHTKPESIKVGKIGDVIVGQMQMTEDDIVWNVRIEKSDDFINNTGIDMSTARETHEEFERVVHGMTFITRGYNIHLVDLDELDASIEAGKEMDLSHARTITIECVLNKTNSILYTFYAERYWVYDEETFIRLPHYERGPAAILKSDADYEMEAYEEEMAKKTEELANK